MKNIKTRLIPVASLFVLMFVFSSQKTRSLDCPKAVRSESEENLYYFLYNDIQNKPSQRAFVLGMKGYVNLQKLGNNKTVFTLIDFSKPSTEKRLWIFDMVTNQVLVNTYVAHGMNTGENEAIHFSNRPGSNKSSLGFYLTGKTYQGKHGLSLKLDGLEQGINSNAMKRAIVLHGATYVSRDFIERYGRLGRSFGCPAVPYEETEYIIDLIKDNSCMFVYYPDQAYLSQSKII